MMHMTIYWGKKVTLLVDWWRTKTWMSYLLTLLACFLFSAFYQYMEGRRLRFKSSTSKTSSTMPSITVSLLSKIGHTRPVISPARLAASLLFGANTAIGYLLMVAIMSCNGGIFLAIVLGLSFGHYLFRSGDE
jgi:copper transporter 1